MSQHARWSDPITSHLAAARTPKIKYRCCLFLFMIDNPNGLTCLDLERFCELPMTRAEFGPRPLGVSPWRRVTDCIEEGWAAVMIDNDGWPVTRMEAFGKHQQVFRITPAGRVKALELINTYEAA